MLPSGPGHNLYSKSSGTSQGEATHNSLDLGLSVRLYSRRDSEGEVELCLPLPSSLQEEALCSLILFVYHSVTHSTDIYEAARSSSPGIWDE